MKGYAVWVSISTLLGKDDLEKKMWGSDVICTFHGDLTFSTAFSLFGYHVSDFFFFFVVVTLQHGERNVNNVTYCIFKVLCCSPPHIFSHSVHFVAKVICVFSCQLFSSQEIIVVWFMIKTFKFQKWKQRKTSMARNWMRYLTHFFSINFSHQ